MRKRLVLSAVAAMVVGGEAMASMGYNYAEGDLLYGGLKTSGDTRSGTGMRFEGGIEIEQELYGFMGFGFHKFSKNGFTTRLSTGALGVGGHIPLGDTLDFVATVAGERVNLKRSGVDTIHCDGWGVGAGLRGQPRNKMQWTAGIKFRSLENLHSIFSLTAGGRYFLTPAFALGLDITGSQYDKKTLDATETTAALTFRFDFGTRY